MHERFRLYINIFFLVHSDECDASNLTQMFKIPSQLLPFYCYPTTKSQKFDSVSYNQIWLKCSKYHPCYFLSTVTQSQSPRSLTVFPTTKFDSNVQNTIPVTSFLLLPSHKVPEAWQCFLLKLAKCCSKAGLENASRNPQFQFLSVALKQIWTHLPANILKNKTSDSKQTKTYSMKEKKKRLQLLFNSPVFTPRLLFTRY